MVNKRVLLLIFVLFLTAPLFSEEIKVISEIDQSSAYENEPLQGTITITHNKDHLVDKDSFHLGKDKLAVELVKEIQIAPNDPLILSIYRFKLPSKPQGLYALPAISVRVGKKELQSTMSSYNVESRKNTSPSTYSPQQASSSGTPQSTQSSSNSSSTSSPTKPLLRLEATIEGKNSFYPGQHTKLVYHYFFSGDIALTKEQLPLLDAKGLIKIGEKDIKDSVEGTESIREISQEVEGVKPGKFSFGPSLIEGYAYKEDTPGQPVYTSEKLSSEAPPVEITVLPFPEKNKPASFNGAVGKYTFKTTLLSSSEMTLGDEISLGLEISGKGNLKNVEAPDLCCQPGYSGNFRLSDLPPTEEINGEIKKITEKIRPLNSQIKEIPSIEFSFFDPETTQYTVLNSQAIPITVKPSSNSVDDSNKSPQPLPNLQEGVSKQISNPKPIEIESIFLLTKNDLYNKCFGTWWSLALIPGGIALLMYQSHLKGYLAWRKSQVPVVTSQELFQQAFSKEKEGKCDFETLKRAFKKALEEVGLISSREIADEELPNEGLCGEVKNFWLLLDEKRFAGDKKYDIGEVRRLSQELLNKIYVITKNKIQGVNG